MYKPWLPIFTANQLCFAVKPDHPSIASENAVHRFERRSLQEHLGGFNAPPISIFRVNLVVPANRIVQPFLTRESKYLFDLRADISLTDASIQIGHKDHGGDLLHKHAVSLGNSRKRAL
jgi:hypothetical protein